MPQEPNDTSREQPPRKPSKSAVDAVDAAQLRRALQEGEELFRQLFEHSGIGMALVDLEGSLTKVNGSLCAFLGYSNEELLTKKFVDITHPDDISVDVQHYQRLRRGEIPYYSIEKRYVTKNGEVVWGQLNAAIVKDDEGCPLYFVGQVQDINDRKLAFEAVRTSERRLRAILEKSFDCVQLVSAEGSIRYASPSLSTILGIAPDDRLGKSIFDVVHPEDLAGFRKGWRALMQSPGESVTLVHRTMHGDGKYRWVESRATNLLRHNDVRAIVINFRDITQSKLAAKSELALRAERDQLLNRLQLQIQRMPIGLMMMDARLRITDWNPAAEHTFGYSKEDVVGREFTDLLPASAHERANKIVHRLQQGDMTAHTHIEINKQQGKPIRCEWYNTPIMDEGGELQTVLSMFVDVTERRRLENQIRQMGKMEALGKLAGGVAHDFNNILTVISGCCDLLSHRSARIEDREVWTREIREASDRAAALTDQLLSFSRHQVLQQQVLDLNEIIEGMESILRRLIGEDIELTTALNPSLPAIRADRNQLEQVIMNLAANARDAMPRGGQLRLETKEVSLPDPESGAAKDVVYHAACYVQLTVSDTGVGMDKSTLQQIFDPFFTTKAAGHGTGLGLATVYGTINQFKGHIRVASNPGEGTQFDVWLPGVTESPSKVTTSEPTSIKFGDEKILLVEDEDAVRITAAAMLKELGYDVVVAADGDEALSAACPPANHIDLLLTDVVMPNMSGPELYRKLRTMLPNLKVVFMSGYTDDRMAQYGISGRDAPFLSKPFNQYRLAQSVGRALVEELPPAC